MTIYGDEKIGYILQELGNRIKEILIRRNMTQKELAQKAGVSFSTVVRIEKGEGVNMENYMRVARVFDLLRNFNLLVPEQMQTPEDIFKGTPKRKRVHKRKKENESTNSSEWI